MLNDEDHKICKSIISPGQSTGMVRFVTIQRQGYMLLGLPQDCRLALATLKLYQPQKRKGRLLRNLVRLSVSLRVYHLFPKCEFAIGNKGLIELLSKKFNTRAIGIILSSPVSQDRNLVAVFESENTLYVAKAGCGESEAVVRMEHERLMNFSGFVNGVPKVVGGYEMEDGFACVTEMVNGDSPLGAEQEAKVWDLLGSWMDQAQTMVMDTIPQWTKLNEKLKGRNPIAGILDEMGKLRVLSPIGHGDFAPWNIKISSGKVIVLDWEYAVKQAIPGLDGLHYLIQKLILVDGLNPEAIYHRCLEWFDRKETKLYFQKARLKGYEEKILGVYLYYASEIDGYERQDLIRIWNNRFIQEG